MVGSGLHGASGGEAVWRLQELAGQAGTQARLIAERVRHRRARQRVLVAVGSTIGCVGLVCSILLLLAAGAAAGPAWLAVATWVAASAPILALLQIEGGDVSDLATKAAGAAGFAEGLHRSAEASREVLDAFPAGADALAPLTSRVERDVAAVGRALQAAERPAEQRRHRRIVPRERRVVVVAPDGRPLRAVIANVSRSGVAMVECLPRLSVGDPVLVGRTPAVTTRVWSRGIAFAFVDELAAATFDEAIVL